jgi:hypothetical protein
MPSRSFIATIIVMGLLAGGPIAAGHAQDLSKFADLSGQWKKPAGIGNGPWDVTKPAGPAQQAPLTAEYQAIYDAKLAERASGGLGGDPTAWCVPHGLPRMMVGIYPMEIIVTPRTTYILSDYNEPRRIFTDGRDWPAEFEPTFNGYSIGKWIDPDAAGRPSVLDVETRGFKGPRTFDGSGIPLHDDNQTIVKERFHLDRADKNRLHIEITTIDHALTRPWSVVRPFQHESNPVWLVVDCSEDNRHVLVGNESYLVSADGFLMPTKKDQQPPDLRYFKKSSK